jgi:uncharacterized protein (TIGR00251 family)
MIRVAPHPEGCLLAVRAQPGARKNAVVGEHAGALKVAVTAPPEDGRANEAITGLLRSWLDLPRAGVEIVRGARSRAKEFIVRGVTAPEMLALLAKKLV